MEATRLSVSPEKLRFQKMSYKKRAQLRRQNIIDLITSKPYGTPIRLSEFSAATQLSEPGAHSLLNTMMKTGIISREKINQYNITYSVNGAVHTVVPPKSVVKSMTAPVAIEELAKQYAWDENSDSLRGFLKWLKARGKVDGGGY